MKIQHLTVSGAFASLNSGPAGPTDAEALRRLAEYAGNQVEEIAREPLLLSFAKEFAHFFAIILWIDYPPWGNALFGTAPLQAAVWFFILPFAIAMVAPEELRKWACRRSFGNNAGASP